MKRLALTLLLPLAGSALRAQTPVFITGNTFLRAGVIDSNGNGPDPSDPPLVTDVQDVFNLNTSETDKLFVTPWTLSMNKTVSFSSTRADRVFLALASGHTVTQSAVFTRDGQGNVTGASFSQVRTDFDGATVSSKEGSASLADQDGDGLFDCFSLEFEGTKVTVDFVFADISGDGKADAVSIPWTLSTLAALGADLDDDTPEEHAVYLPLGDVGGGVTSVGLDLDGNGFADPQSPRMAAVGGEPGHSMYFAHFGDGEASGVQLLSEFLLGNSNGTDAAATTVRINGDDGSPLSVDLNGQTLGNGSLDVMIPASGLSSLKTDGQGDLVAGSAVVTSDQALSGVIVFGGTVGAAGVGASLPQSSFVAPMVTNATTNTGIAMMNPSGTAAVTVNLNLLDPQGTLLATGSEDLVAGGHVAKFLDQIAWTEEAGVTLDLANFEGVLRGTTASGQVAATVLQTRPGQFITMPVAIPAQTGVDTLFFPQFGDGSAGGVSLSSEIVLMNLSTSNTANVTISLRGDDGMPLMGVDLNAEVLADGSLTTSIPASGVIILRTDGAGDIVVGSATVASDQPLGGVIVFDSAAGAAGVPASFKQDGFIAPMVTDTATNTGLAMMNPGTSQVDLDLQLRDDQGTLLATASLSLDGNGHRALFVNEIEWVEEAGVTLDFTDFRGLLRATANGKVSATVLQTAGNEFVTMPVGVATN